MSDSASETALQARAGNKCELCNATENLTALAVLPAHQSGPNGLILTCGVCRAQIEGESDLDANHWFCLQESAWSGVPAVQAVVWRLLSRLNGESWAQGLLEQIYLDEETLAWAKEGMAAATGNKAAPKIVDSNGTPLAAGDSVMVIKDLDVKGTSFVAKRGTVVKGIRLTDDPELIEGRVNKVTIVIKTCFLKKA